MGISTQNLLLQTIYIYNIINCYVYMLDNINMDKIDDIGKKKLHVLLF